MKTLTKIVCRTVGTAGMGVALYDAMRVANYCSKNTAQTEESKYLEKAYFNSRTTDNMSYVDNAIRKKTFDLRTKNPIPSFWGRTKGWVQGAFNSLGNNLLTVACSACAILSKGILAKIGAVGVGLGVCYNILRNGFGLGKHNPMD